MAGFHRPRAARVIALAFALAATAAPARTETLTLTLDDGRTLPAQLRVPDRARRPLPALMLFGGFRHAAQVLDKVHTDRAVIWATFDYPFEPPRKFHFPDSLKEAPEARAAIHGSFQGIGKLYRALANHADVDPARITIVGASAGAPFATVGAARHPIPGVILVQGFADVPAVIAHQIARKYRARFGDWIETPAYWLAAWIDWYCRIPDIAAHARLLRPTQKALLFTAAQDDFVPKAATESLWQALEQSQAKHERVDLPGLHLGVGDDGARITEILQRSMRWMERENLL